MRCSLTPLTNQRPRIVLDWPLGLGFRLCQGGGRGRVTPRVPLAVGIIVVCPIGRGPVLIQGTRAIIQLQLTIIQRKVEVLGVLQWGIANRGKIGGNWDPHSFIRPRSAIRLCPIVSLCV
jgi:hypothetical protein